MKRVIIDYKRLTPDLLKKAREQYPDGYSQEDIISFSNHKNEEIDAIQISTADTLYLVKIGNHFGASIDSFETELNLDESAEGGFAEEEL